MVHNLIFVFIILTASAFGALNPIKNVEPQYNQRNIVLNPGFEQGKTYWTANGVDLGHSATAPRTGGKKGTFTATVQNGYIVSTLVACKDGSLNAEAFGYYKNGTSTTHVFSVINNSSSVMATVNLPAAAVWRKTPTLGFTCVSGDTYQIKIYDTKVSAWELLELDDMFIGGTQIAQLGISGTVFAFAGSSCPPGTLYADGTLISRTQYAVLFSAIGTTWGAGDGSTTFALPNLLGAVLRGNGTGVINARNKVGPTVGTFQEDNLQGHWHNIIDDNTTSYAAATTTGTGTGFGYISAAGGVAASARTMTNGTNGTVRPGDETRPYAAGILYCVVK